MIGLQVIKLDELKKIPSQKKNYLITLDEAEVKEQIKHIAFSCPINLDLTISLENDIYHVDGKLTSKTQLECSRCLKPISYDLSYDFSEDFSVNPKDDEDIIQLEKEELDLWEIVREIVEFSIPKKVLCEESCLGLCPQCGCNLNISKCQCEGDNVDPRLAILKNLLKK